MKKTTLILATLTLVLGFVSCKRDKPVEEEKIATVVIEPSTVTLTLGETETAKLQVKWTPSTVKATPEFISENPEVATVSGNGQVGEVKAIAEGTTTITVKVGEKSANATVVVKKGEMPLPKPELNQLPLFRYNLDNEEVAKEVKEYEAKMGRKIKSKALIQLPQSRYDAYIGEQLDFIPVVAYGVMMGGDQLIIALGKEPMDNCEKTLKMLQANGFPRAEVQTVRGQKQYWGMGQNDKGDRIELWGHTQEIANEEGQPATNTFITFTYMPSN